MIYKLLQSLTGFEIFCLVLVGLVMVLFPFCRFLVINRIANGLGLLLFAVLTINQLNELRLGHWTIGPYLTPVQVVGPDGRHLDGVPNIDAGSDMPGFWWCFYLICIGCPLLGWWEKRKQAGRG